ncbi:MAG: hypothetical protein Q7J28_07045 [Caulobacter sp.]|nr:hypothetical protein [Caulobacter sp.]
MMRLVPGVVAGVVCGFVVIYAVEQVGQQIWPVATKLDLKDKAAAAAFLANMPLGGLLTVLAAWILGAYTGSVVGLLAADRRRIAGVIPAAVIFAATVLVLFMLPHPLWMAVGGLGGIIAAGGLADRLFARKG